MDDPVHRDELSRLRRALIALLPGFVLADAARAAAPPPGAARVAFDNDDLRALEYRSWPGTALCGEGMHTHPAHLAVALDAMEWRERTPGGAWQTNQVKRGDVRWHDALTHEAESLAGRDARLYRIELKPGRQPGSTAIGGPAPELVQSSSFRVAFENEHLRALEYRSRPGMGVCGSGVHSHPAHLTVGLFDGQGRVRPAGGSAWKSFAAKVGDVFWSEAETHEVENLTGRDGLALLIELKPRKE